LFGQATQNILAISTLANGYIQQRAPWDLMKDPDKHEEARNVLTLAVNAIKVIAVLLKPILPEYCTKLELMLGTKELTWTDAAFGKKTLKNRSIGQFEKLLDRLEPGSFKELVESCSNAAVEADAAPVPAVPEFEPEITIEDLAKIDLRAGKIVTAQAVEGADKLVKLEIDLGREVRTIFAGIKQHYQPDDLVGRMVAVVANLKPRKMKFGTSQGMVLAGVDPDGAVTVCEVDPSIAAGSKIQ
jgi:methionyl-tRNA synthetase